MPSDTRGVGGSDIVNKYNTDSAEQRTKPVKPQKFLSRLFSNKISQGQKIGDRNITSLKEVKEFMKKELLESKNSKQKANLLKDMTYLFVSAKLKNEDDPEVLTDNSFLAIIELVKKNENANDTKDKLKHIQRLKESIVNGVKEGLKNIDEDYLIDYMVQTINIMDACPEIVKPLKDSKILDKLIEQIKNFKNITVINECHKVLFADDYEEYEGYQYLSEFIDKLKHNPKKQTTDIIDSIRKSIAKSKIKIEKLASGLTSSIEKTDNLRSLSNDIGKDITLLTDKFIELNKEYSGIDSMSGSKLILVSRINKYFCKRKIKVYSAKINKLEQQSLEISKKINSSVINQHKIHEKNKLDDSNIQYPKEISNIRARYLYDSCLKQVESLAEDQANKEGGHKLNMDTLSDFLVEKIELHVTHTNGDDLADIIFVHTLHKVVSDYTNDANFQNKEDISEYFNEKIQATMFNLEQEGFTKDIDVGYYSATNESESSFKYYIDNADKLLQDYLAESNNEKKETIITDHIKGDSSKIVKLVKGITHQINITHDKTEKKKFEEIRKTVIEAINKQIISDIDQAIKNKELDINPIIKLGELLELSQQAGVVLQLNKDVLQISLSLLDTYLQNPEIDHNIEQIILIYNIFDSSNKHVVKCFGDKKALITNTRTSINDIIVDFLLENLKLQDTNTALKDYTKIKNMIVELNQQNIKLEMKNESLLMQAIVYYHLRILHRIEHETSVLQESSVFIKNVFEESKILELKQLLEYSLFQQDNVIKQKLADQVVKNLDRIKEKAIKIEEYRTSKDRTSK